MKAHRLHSAVRKKFILITKIWITIFRGSWGAKSTTVVIYEECPSTTRHINNADAKSWHAEWNFLAEHALQNGEQETTRKAFLRARIYHRAPLFIMGRKHPDFYSHSDRMKICFQKAAKLFDPLIEPIEVPFQGGTLSGYFWKVDDSKTPRPTLVVVGGVET
jgi:hypothetical protein